MLSYDCAKHVVLVLRTALEHVSPSQFLLAAAGQILIPIGSADAYHLSPTPSHGPPVRHSTLRIVTHITAQSYLQHTPFSFSCQPYSDPVPLKVFEAFGRKAAHHQYVNLNISISCVTPAHGHTISEKI
jgi:hypothetical protein